MGGRGGGAGVGGREVKGGAEWCWRGGVRGYRREEEIGGVGERSYWNEKILLVSLRRAIFEGCFLTGVDDTDLGLIGSNSFDLPIGFVWEREKGKEKKKKNKKKKKKRKGKVIFRCALFHRLKNSVRGVSQDAQKQKKKKNKQRNWNVPYS